MESVHRWLSLLRTLYLDPLLPPPSLCRPSVHKSIGTTIIEPPSRVLRQELDRQS